jgi:hypothetical protein
MAFGPVPPRQQPGMQKPEEEGLLSRIGAGIQNFRGDPEKMARLQMGFNSMRLNPDAGIAASARDTIQQAQARRTSGLDANTTIAYLKTQTNNPMAQQAAAAIQANPAMAKDILSAFLSNQMKPTNTIAQQSGAQLNARPGGGAYDPLAMYNITNGPEGQKISKIGGGGTTVTTNVNSNKEPPGLEALNKAYAQDHLDWTRGGGADMSAQVAQIDTVLQQLESGAELTGPGIAVINSLGLLGLVNPEAENAKEMVQEVVQRNLKLVLGAQFAQKEGEQLISRAYNPALPPATNARRLKKLYKQMEIARQQRQAMADYFSENYTLKGYQGPQPKMADFYSALSQFSVGQVVKGFEYLGGNSNDEKNWKKVGM